MSPHSEAIPAAVRGGRVRDARDAVGLCALTLALGTAWWLAPSWHDWRLEPEIAALVAGSLSIVLIMLLRTSGRRGSSLERWIVAAFLAAMPLIYVAAWFVQPMGSAWLVAELVGVVLFGATCVAGLRRSAWYLALGIFAHGVGWDAWHHGTAGFIAAWYPSFCGAADVGIAIYVATQVRAYES